MREELRLSADIAHEMISHSVEGRPNEACGILAAKEGSIVKVFKMVNASASPLRYSLDPKEQFAVYKTLDENSWELGGVFHSHTRTEAYPSPTDVKRASEDVPYLIVSLMNESPSIRAYRIVKENWTDETGEVTEIPVVIDPV
ncbi:MAG: Mov34/MPN/PAD-1 family protein [Actinomycetota bacterium]